MLVQLNLFYHCVLAYKNSRLFRVSLSQLTSKRKADQKSQLLLHSEGQVQYTWLRHTYVNLNC